MDSKTWYQNGNYQLIKNLKVFYRREGSGSSLICLHGFPSSSWDFAPLWPTLKNHFDVLASDLIGLGRSAKLQIPLTVNLQADVIEGLLVELGIQEAHILAHDLGDTVAQELLARQLEGKAKISWLSLVLLNGGLFPESHQPLFIQKLLYSAIGPWVVQLMTEKSVAKSFNNIFSAQHPPTEEFIKDTWRLIISDNGRSMIPRLLKYLKERKTYRERWVRPLIEQIVPIRLINGGEDPISGRHMAKRFQELVPQSDVVLLENAGHYPHVETPQAVLDALFEFHKSV